MSEKIIKTDEIGIENEIRTLKNVFPIVRLLSAEEVGAAVKDCKNKRITGDCYEIWNRKKTCENCISYRVLTEKKQLSKIEKFDGKTYQVIADYREVDGKPCVLEMIKEFDEDIIVEFGDEDAKIQTLTEYFDKTYTDVLTSAYNRRYYEEYIANEPLVGGLAMIDADDFKIYNDLFGHDVGDAVLKAIAAVIKESVRGGDKVVRYGGDEFLLVVYGVKKEAFGRCVRDITAAVKEITFDEYPAIRPSVSVGYTICSGETIKSAVSRADEFMYLAKKKKDFVVSDKNEINEAEKGIPEKARVLVVDDSALNREILGSILKNEYDIVEAENGRRAVELMEKIPDLSAVLLDLVMPEMNGFEVLDYMNERNITGGLPVIAITGDESSDSMRTAYEKGVSDYITRPFDAKVVYRRVSNAIKIYSRQKKLISQITGEMSNKEKNRNMIVEILSRIIEGDNGKGTHSMHMMKFSEILLEKLIRKGYGGDITEKDVYAASTAAVLHDVGKLQIDKKILDKKGSLTPEEFEIVKTHTILGEKILKQIKDYEKEPLLKYACEICRHHHERYDGSGYPDGLSGDRIPLVAQVVSLCDVYDALVSERSYKPAYSHEKAVAMITGGECGAFNPVLTDCFKDCFDEFEKIIDEDNKIE